MQRDREFQELMEVAQQQGKVHQEMQLLEKEVEKRDSDIQQLQKQLKEAEHILVGGVSLLFNNYLTNTKTTVHFSQIITGSSVDLNRVLFLFFKATAVYQAKEKLKSIDKARKGELTHQSYSF